jgi:prolyl oligopeptidase
MTAEQLKVDMYPETLRDDTVEKYGEESIPDPYRWLEDDNSEETVDWVKRQNVVTSDYLAKIPFKERISSRLSELWDYEKVSAPFKEGDSYYFFKNDGLQNQSVMYTSAELGGEGQVFFDPNKLSDDGTSSLGGFSFNEKGDKMAYQVSEGGSDWRTIYVKDVASGNNLEDKIEWVKFSGMAWTPDGFYYSRYPASDDDGKLSAKNEYHSVYFHKLGTAQSEDKLIYKDNDYPQRNAYAGTSEDGKYFYVAASESTSGNSLAIGETATNTTKKVVEGFDHDFSLIDNDGEQMLFLTNKGAPKNRLIAIDYNNPAEANWKEVIPESEDALRNISIVGNRIFANYLHNASSLIKVFNLDGSFIQDLELPCIGTTGGISGKKEGDVGFFSITSFTNPTAVYKLNPQTLESEVYKEPKLDIDLSKFKTEQVWYTSKDGTKIPMFLTYKKDLVLDGKRPTLLYGYGGFDIPITPSFSIKRLPILENDGIYAVANIRGGGEFGSEWHKAGTKERKQNVFDDFQAAAEYLISANYTNSSKLAIEGRSNGGLLVGACMTQRPDLYAVAFPGVGVLDMLRYHKFTIGWAWAGDYGRSDDPEAFEYLKAYSPLHNLKEIEYPATMVTTADHDDRVVPAHSFKFISELQHKHQGDNPVLIRIETSAGHGAGKPTSKQIEEAADELSFMYQNFGVNPYSN